MKELRGALFALVILAAVAVFYFSGGTVEAPKEEEPKAVSRATRKQPGDVGIRGQR